MLPKWAQQIALALLLPFAVEGSLRAQEESDDAEALGDEGAETAPARAPAYAGLRCTPEAREVQTRRPIPVACETGGEASRMSLRYREHRGAPWKTLRMRRGASDFRAEIPCEATRDSGTLELFVVAVDELGDPIDTLGTKAEPERLSIDPRSKASPPHYPGQPAPARCEEKVICPPDFPGCEDDSAPEDDEDGAADAGSFSRNFFGLHFAADIGFIGGSNVCATGNRDFDCFASGQPYPAELPPNVAAESGELGDVYPGTGIGSGASAGTFRALLAYDRALGANVLLGARLGMAFGGGPETADGRGFLPIHAEGRLTYSLVSLESSGVRPYLHLGGGIAQVDVKKSGVRVRDCSTEPARSAFLECIEARGAYDSANQPALPERDLDAYRKLGNAFVTTGAGVSLPLTGKLEAQVNVNAMLMMPSTGLVVQPSVGLIYAL